MYQVFWSTLILATALSACNYKREKSSSQSDDLVAAFDGEVYYATVRDQVFEPKCVECHNPGNLKGNADLSSYEAVVRHLDRIKVRSIDLKTMPPTDEKEPLSGTEYQLLKAWISAGAPRDAASASDPAPVPTPTLLPLAPNFESLNQNIFEPRCKTCHNANPSDPDAENILISEADLIAKKLIIPGDPDLSRLVKLSSPKPNGGAPRMPPSDSGLPILSETELKTLREWILNLPKQ